MFNQSGYFTTPPVVKNLIIINVLFFMATALLPNGLGEMLYEKLGLFFWESRYFQPHQFITYMFLHANFQHLFFNMFALWMFGRGLEYDLGSKRFLTYYMITGIGAGIIQMLVSWGEISYMKEAVEQMSSNPYAAQTLMSNINGVTIGASGAVFGVLLAFGMLHPNNIIMLLIPPIPIKAKYFVIGYGVLELFLGVSGSGGNIAHFAHIGGMLWGFLLLKYWKKTGKIYY